MEAYDLPVLNQIAFGVGFGAAMFWPAWLVAFVLGVISFARRQKVSGSAMVGVAVAPVIILGVFFVLVQLEVDVGAEDGMMARALGASAWAFFGFTVLCLLGFVAVLARWTVAWLRSKRGRLYA